MSNVQMAEIGERMLFVIDGRSYPVESDHPHREQIQTLVNNTEDLDTVAQELRELVVPSEGVRTFLEAEGNAQGVEIRGGRIFYKGEPVHSGLGERIVRLKASGGRYRWLFPFLANVEEMESRSARESLFDFLDHRGCPITTDGYFLAFKGVREDYTDIHSGTFRNRVGDRPRVARRDVDDDRNNACSHGLHVGAEDFARMFARGGRVMVVKVRPQDVVCVPVHEPEKVRVTTYEVVAEATPERGQFREHEVVGDRGSPFKDPYDFENPPEDPYDWY